MDGGFEGDARKPIDLQAGKGVVRTIGELSSSDQVWKVLLLGVYYD